MSMELMVKAMKAKVGNPLRKLVLIKLADNANDQGECWPSYEYISQACEISERSAINHINALVDVGLVRKITRKSEHKRNTSNLYILDFSSCVLSDKPVQTLPFSEGAANSPLENTEGAAYSPLENIGGAADSPLANFEGAANAPMGAGDSPSEGAGAAPRISHSFEPINESLKDSCPATSAKSVFNAFFKAYPAHRKGGSDSAAWKAWKAEKLTDADCVLAVTWLKDAAALDTSWGFSANGQFVLGITKFIRERHWLTPLPRPMAAAVGQVDWSYAVYDPEDPLI
ncbi:helix-turn-helix domain-containing protein [Shewanella oncorhynchi]|uniref:helix-turn-helix domain-containing protein n=1 Tax=Shewanella oncorhynchi TaxID=2726434 RepID=UPI002E7ABC33|nr:helix-turn-helix domain-containing protein [Shewanella oncorhynchi]WVI91579.1 helix-turn-helix domain-containing protein [Shewanella oncorhynchi]